MHRNGQNTKKTAATTVAVFFEKHTGGQLASAQPAIMPVKAVRAAMMTCITMLQKVFLDSFMILLGLGY